MREEIEREVRKYGFNLLDKEVKDKENLLNVSSKEGYIFYVKMGAIKRGNPLPFHQNNPWSIWNIKKVWLPLNAPDYELLEDKYIKASVPMRWRNKKLELDVFTRSWSGFKSRPVDPTLSDQGTKKSTEQVLLELHKKVSSHKGFEDWEMCCLEHFKYESKNQLINFRHKKGFLSVSKINTIINTDNGLHLFHASIPVQSIYNIKMSLRLNELPYKLVEGQTFINREKPLHFICLKHDKEFEDLYLKVIEDDKRCPLCFREKMLNNHAYERASELTDEEEVITSTGYKGLSVWSNSVKERDGFKCQCCYSTTNISTHHKDGFHWCVERRLDITNGVSLCNECHVTHEFAFHRIYGNSHNTEEQYTEWLSKYQQKINDSKN